VSYYSNFNLNSLSHAEWDVIFEKYKGICRECEYCNHSSAPSCQRLNDNLLKHIVDGKDCPEGKW
jgi:hypothetical protein